MKFTDENKNGKHLLESMILGPWKYSEELHSTEQFCNRHTAIIIWTMHNRYIWVSSWIWKPTPRALLRAAGMHFDQSEKGIWDWPMTVEYVAGYVTKIYQYQVWA